MFKKPKIEKTNKRRDQKREMGRDEYLALEKRVNKIEKEIEKLKIVIDNL